MSNNEPVNRWLETATSRGAEYDRRFEQLAALGKDVHGEADLVASICKGPVLDAGCGTGRVAIELYRRGFEVVGLDIDPRMLERAKDKEAGIEWILGDLATADLGRSFDAIVLAGNVMVFLTPGSEGAVLANLARQLSPSGTLVAGFSLSTPGLSLEHFDRLADEVGLVLMARFATWEGTSYPPGGDYAVSLLTWPDNEGAFNSRGRRPSLLHPRR